MKTFPGKQESETASGISRKQEKPPECEEELCKSDE